MTDWFTFLRMMVGNYNVLKQTEDKILTKVRQERNSLKQTENSLKEKAVQGPLNIGLYELNLYFAKT